jgi:hypothetical protein
MATVIEKPGQPVQDKARQLVVKLLRETLEGRIEWSRADPPRAITGITEDVIDPYFVVRFGEERIGIWQRNYHAMGPDGREWSKLYGLCLLGSGRQEVIWDFEESSPAMRNLLQAARDQTVRIEERLDQLLRVQPSGGDNRSTGKPTITTDHA